MKRLVVFLCLFLVNLAQAKEVSSPRCDKLRKEMRKAQLECTKNKDTCDAYISAAHAYMDECVVADDPPKKPKDTES